MTLSAAPERAVTIPITVANQGTASAADYTLSATSVSFAATETSQTITLTATADTIDDDGESVKLSFGALPAGVTAGGTSEATVAITDDDEAGVVLSRSALTVTEGDAAGASYTVKLAAQPTATVTVTITGQATTDLALSGTTLSNTATLTFTDSNWATAQTVTVKAAQDADAADDAVTLTHTASGGGYTETAELAVTVDDDETSVRFGLAMYSATEGGPDATVTVILSRPATSQVGIDITATAHGQATSADWSGVPTSLTFNAGEDTMSFTVVAVDDVDEDDGEMVELSFGTLPAGYIPGTPSTAEITLMNDDNGSNGNLRLVDGTLTDDEGRLCEGRLEIFYDGAWGTICDDYWTKEDADVACRALGFAASVDNPGPFRAAYFGQGTGDIVLDDLFCDGTESGLLECESAWPSPGQHNCTARRGRGAAVPEVPATVDHGRRVQRPARWATGAMTPVRRWK